MLINQIVNEDSLTEVFAALADPTRRSIIERLSAGTATVNEIALHYDMSLPAVSKHLKVLEQAGLIYKTANAQKRECHLDAVRLQLATEWLNNYRELWENRLSSLDDYLQSIKQNKED